MLKKIETWLDRVLWTMIASGTVLMIVGMFLVIFQDNINGVGPFLLGFGVFYYAVIRIKILNRKLSKDWKGDGLKCVLVIWCTITIVVVLNQNIGARIDMRLASVLLFPWLIWFEARHDWTEHASANG